MNKEDKIKTLMLVNEKISLYNAFAIKTLLEDENIEASMIYGKKANTYMLNLYEIIAKEYKNQLKTN